MSPTGPDFDGIREIAKIASEPRRRSVGDFLTIPMIVACVTMIGIVVGVICMP